MDIEFYKKPGLFKNPDYQKGKELGSQAVDPLSVLQSTDVPSITGRKEFLAGYATALERYLNNKKIVLPIGVDGHLRYDIDFPSFLSGVVAGLKRESPNRPMAFEFQGSGKYEDPQTWADTLSLIAITTKTDGYIIGFLASLARDYGIITHGHAIPTNNEQYPVYLDGLAAKPSKYFFRKGDKSLGGYAPEEYDKRVYMTGLKVWLHEQGFGQVVCPALLVHPDTLIAFKGFIETGNRFESKDRFFEAQTGYKLAQEVIGQRDKQPIVASPSVQTA